MCGDCLCSHGEAGHILADAGGVVARRAEASGDVHRKPAALHGGTRRRAVLVDICHELAAVCEKADPQLSALRTQVEQSGAGCLLRD